jgi:hypothetical protein
MIRLGISQVPLVQRVAQIYRAISLIPLSRSARRPTHEGQDWQQTEIELAGEGAFRSMVDYPRDIVQRVHDPDAGGFIGRRFDGPPFPIVRVAFDIALKMIGHLVVASE